MRKTLFFKNLNTNLSATHSRKNAVRVLLGRASESQRIIGVILSLCIGWGGTEGLAAGREPLTLAEQTIAFAIDRAAQSLDYEFQEVTVEGQKSGVSWGPMSFGEAMIVNERLHRGLGFPILAATIKAKLLVGGRPYGRVILRWNPSRDLLQLVVGMILFRMDRAYAWPQLVLDLFPTWFQARISAEPFEIEWLQLGEVLDAPEDREELQFVATILKEMKILNPDVNELRARGNVLYYPDRSSNKTIFVFEVDTEFPGALSCQQRIRTNYNPFTSEARTIKGTVACEWSKSLAGESLER